MTVSDLLSLLVSVLTTREVIIITIAIALYVNIVNYIVRYRKKKAVPKAKKARAESEKKVEVTDDEGASDEESES